MYQQRTSKKIMNINSRTANLLTFLLATILWLSAVTSAQTPAGKQGQALAPQAGSTPVTGSGMTGRLSKWTGVSGLNTFTLGDSGIFEDKFGKVGIGTLTPTSMLTVQGMIETTLGGYKFPDGSIQTTAAVNGLQSIFHNATLTGNGTQASPLGIAIPLELSGAAGDINTSVPLLKITNTAHSGLGLSVQAGDSNSGPAGQGIFIRGGNGSQLASGGSAIIGYGGNGALSPGGDGVVGKGGESSGTGGGNGVVGVGGKTLKGSPSAAGIGVLAIGGAGHGAISEGGTALYANRGPGFEGATNGLAGYFSGDVEIQGNFNVTGGGSKNFKIDHPLDPENKYLYHAAIESSEVLNVYSGNITTDGTGEAVVTLPDWFEAINKDFRYQLTVVGTFAQAIVAEEINNNTFKIKTNAAGVKVSWQVTGVRSDAAILKHPFKLEENKSQSERGSYLTPDAYNQPEERGIEWARNPQMMREIKQQRTEPGQGKQQKPMNQ
jgi:hypothetical protein